VSPGFSVFQGTSSRCPLRGFCIILIVYPERRLLRPGRRGKRPGYRRPSRFDYHRPGARGPAGKDEGNRPDHRVCRGRGVAIHRGRHPGGGAENGDAEQKLPSRPKRGADRSAKPTTAAITDPVTESIISTGRYSATTCGQSQARSPTSHHPQRSSLVHCCHRGVEGRGDRSRIHSASLNWPTSQPVWWQFLALSGIRR
jgi:hypothetical protein